MTPPQIQLLVILASALALILSNAVRPDLVAILAMLSMALFGIITPEQALAGFSKPAVMALVGLFVITQALDANGVIHWLGNRLEKLGGASEARLVAVFMLAGAVLSMVMNNLAAGSVLLPAAVGACRRSKVAPSRLLLPLAYGILMGGMATLFTTANLVVSGVLDGNHLVPLTMVDFMRTGGCLLFVGMAYMVLVGRKLLPKQGSLVPGAVLIGEAPSSDVPLQHYDLLETYHLTDSLFEVTITEDGPPELLGKTVQEGAIGSNYGVSLLAVFRKQAAIFDPRPDERLGVGDVLLLLGDRTKIGKLEQHGLRMGRDRGRNARRNLPVRLAEAIIAPRSKAIGKDLIRLRLRDRYGVTAVGLWRQGKSYLTDISKVELEAGDALLLVGSKGRVESMSQSGDYLIPELPPQIKGSTFKAFLTLIVASIAMALAAEGLFPLALAMLLGGAVLVVFRCLTMDEAYQGVEWNVVVLIAAMAPVGQALTSTGLASEIALSLQGLAQYGPHVFMMANYLLAVIAAQVIGGQVASLVVAPVAIASAVELHNPGVDPRMVGLLVALGCSTAFMTPMAHPVNILMMGPGGYRPIHFLKVGLPLTILCILVIAALMGAGAI